MLVESAFADSSAEASARRKLRRTGPRVAPEAHRGAANVIPPISIVLFIALTLAGTYFVRRVILERTMFAAMEMATARPCGFGDTFPSPVNARHRKGALPSTAPAMGRRRSLAKAAISREG